MGSISNKNSAFISRLTADPGLPRPNPTTSVWQQPPHPELSNIQSASLPTHADTVIIGSGITACSVASHLLESSPDSQITILEARTLCSGATGRNGGHVKSAAVREYAFWEPKIGKAAAKKIIAFTFANSDALFELADSLSEDDRRASEMRKVESLNVLLDPDTISNTEEALKLFEDDNEEWRGVYRLVDKEDAVEKYGLAGAAAVLAGPAGAAWPYRLVTAVYAGLIAQFPSSLRIETNTPATSITTASPLTKYAYNISTPRGSILSKRVIYCINGYTSHLLPRLNGKIFPTRGIMTVQRPPRHINPTANNSWGLIHSGSAFDYMTQNPYSADLFLGGGLFQSENGGCVEFGNSDDTEISPLAIKHLTNVLPAVFGKDEFETQEIKAMWSGVMGFTADGMPLLGRLPSSVTGRPSQETDFDGGEWIAGGFNGYGMVNAWLSGKAVAQMVSGIDVSEWLPDGYVCSESRLRRMTPDLFADAGFGGVKNPEQAPEI